MRTSPIFAATAALLLSLAPTDLSAQDILQLTPEIEDLSAKIQQRRRANAMSAEVQQLRTESYTADQQYERAVEALPQIRNIDRRIEALKIQLSELRQARRDEIEKRGTTLAEVRAKREAKADRLRAAMQDDAATRELTRRRDQLIDATNESQGRGEEQR